MNEPATTSAHPQANPTPSLLDRLWGIRDDVIANANFQRWASRFPLTRPIARRQARAAFDLCAGFVYSQILTACIEIDLLRSVASEPASAATLAERHSLPLNSMKRLLAAALPLGLVARRSNDKWGLGMLGAAIVGQPGLSDMIRHHALLYADLVNPVALLRNQQTATHLACFWPYAATNTPTNLTNPQVARYSELMAASQAMISQDILDCYPIGRHRKLLDIGGGEGAFITAAARAEPKLNLALFDLPAVTKRAQERLTANGLAARVDIASGDFLTDPLPSGADLISLIRVIHDHDDDAAVALLRKAHCALQIGGSLLLAEPMAATPGAETMGDSYFGFYLLAMGSGRPRAPTDLMEMLRAAGFSRSRLLRTSRPLLVRAIAAEA